MFAPRQRGHRSPARAPSSHAAGRRGAIGHRRRFSHTAALPAGTMAGQAGRAGGDGQAARSDVAAAGPALAAVAPPRRDATIVGHRLANGYMSVHGMGQPCGICDGAGPLPPRRVRARRSLVPDLEPIL